MTFMSLTVAESDLSANACILVCFDPASLFLIHTDDSGKVILRLGESYFGDRQNHSFWCRRISSFHLSFFHAPLLHDLALCIIHSVFIMG